MSKIIKTFCSLALFVALLGPTALAAEVPSATEVQVSGVYQEEISPDVVYINLGTLTEADTVGAAQSKNAEISSHVQQQLERIGIKTEHIKTSQYTVTPLYKNDDSRHNYVIKGYQVTNSITVTTTPDKAGEAIDIALAAGCNQVNHLQFGKKDDDAVKNAALAQAVRNGLNKANAIASALNKRVVRIKTITESGISVQNPDSTNQMYRMKALAEAAPPTPISAGLLKLNATVHLVVELD
ncbi:SIMPL domain-containing protein [Anaeromusa acidaminophila]|uniref:SIMPL domain-containing protein n=1 Tax=Anaeromusa acidaminophila TaxID=81464 RepID=UPI000382B527|nr:SIMPL domain-containing protein [Anaeromusa acidaminophila]